MPIKYARLNKGETVQIHRNGGCRSTVWWLAKQAPWRSQLEAHLLLLTANNGSSSTHISNEASKLAFLAEKKKIKYEFKSLKGTKELSKLIRLIFNICLEEIKLGIL